MKSPIDSLPAPDAVRAGLDRLAPWLRRRGLEDGFVERLAGVANPARALANLEELIAAGEEPGAEVLEPLLRVLGASQALAVVLRNVPGAGLEWFRAALDMEAVGAAEHVSELRRAASVYADGGDPFAVAELPVVLRRYKRRQVLRIGARDLVGRSPVEETMRELSALAEGAIEAAVLHGRAQLERDYGGFAAGDDLRFVVLGMGKLGGGELNYSSDIDLVYVYDGGRGGTAGGPRGTLSGAGAAARIAEVATRTLSAVGDEGFVFRVDLRLRPDGQNGPIAISLPNALTYYESWGQTWERAAMLKARPVGGDRALGEHFLREMHPFLYRRYLDFAAIEEIHEMKARVEREHSGERMERDVKLGRGGIREIEFIVQALQLIHCGRDERLRARATLEALRALAERGILPAEEAERLTAAYRFLRDVEHKIQILHERQTHLLPNDADEERILARRLGVRPGTPPDASARGPSEAERFRADLARHRRAVHEAFQRLFSDAKAEVGRQGDDEARWILRSLDERPNAVRHQLGILGFRDAAAAVANVRRLRDGPRHAPSSPRRRKALVALAPALFTEIRRASDPDLALHHMAEFISAIGARTSFLALLEQNPKTLRLLVGLFGSSRYLSNFFLRHPELLDSLVRADLARVRKSAADLERELAELLATAADYEAELDSLRRFRNEEFLRIGVNDIHGLLGPAEVHAELSLLAEVCLRAALAVAGRGVAERHGPAPGRFAVVGMGKLGSRELDYNSDLDLIFVYDPAPALAVGLPAAGERPPLSVHEYFTKLAQRLMVVLQLTTREGWVYKIDTRLRPSGSHGPLVSSMSAFRAYHEESSALWERQALIRARVVAGDDALAREVEAVIGGFVYGRGISPADVAGIARLRERMERELARESEGRWNVKTGRGGLVDVEFLAQMLQLRHGAEHPAVRARDTEGALEALHAEGLLDEADYRALVDGYRFLRRLDSRMRIERDQPVEAVETEGGRLAALARRLGYAGSPASAAERLLADFSGVRESVRAVWDRQFGGDLAIDTVFRSD